MLDFYDDSVQLTYSFKGSFVYKLLGLGGGLVGWYEEAANLALENQSELWSEQISSHHHDNRQALNLKKKKKKKMQNHVSPEAVQI